MCEVIISGRTYQKSEREVRALLQQASDQVPCGVYAFREGTDRYQLVQMPMSRTQTKRYRQKGREQGIKVYCNGI